MLRVLIVAFLVLLSVKNIKDMLRWWLRGT